MWAEGPGATTEGGSLGLVPCRLKRGRVTGATLLHAGVGEQCAPSTSAADRNAGCGRGPKWEQLADVSSLGRDHRRRPTSAQGSLWGESEHGLPSKKGRWVASSRVRCGSLASEDMARGGGGQRVRVFGIRVILDPILVVGF